MTPAAAGAGDPDTTVVLIRLPGDAEALAAQLHATLGAEGIALAEWHPDDTQDHADDSLSRLPVVGAPLVFVLVGAHTVARLTASPSLAKLIALAVRNNQPVVPVLADGAAVVDLAAVPGRLGLLATVQALYWDGSAATSVRLLEQVRALLAQRQRLVAVSRTDAELGRLLEQNESGPSLDAVQAAIAENVRKAFGGLS